MRQTWRVARREFRSYFDHPTAYILVVAFLVLALFLSFRSIFTSGAATLRPLFDLLPWLLAVFVPAITMRSLAEERRSGTLGWLLAQPMSEVDLVVGKFLGDWMFVLVALAGTLPTALGDPGRLQRRSGHRGGSVRRGRAARGRAGGHRPVRLQHHLEPDHRVHRGRHDRLRAHPGRAPLHADRPARAARQRGGRPLRPHALRGGDAGCDRPARRALLRDGGGRVPGAGLLGGGPGAAEPGSRSLPPATHRDGGAGGGGRGAQPAERPHPRPPGPHPQPPVHPLEGHALDPGRPRRRGHDQVLRVQLPSVRGGPDPPGRPGPAGRLPERLGRPRPRAGGAPGRQGTRGGSGPVARGSARSSSTWSATTSSRSSAAGWGWR